MSIVEIVRSKVKYKDITNLEIEVAINEVKQTILNYCNLEYMPKELDYTCANMVADLVRYNYISSGNSENSENTNADISSLKIGDTNISLGTPETAEGNIVKSHVPNLDEIVLNYKSQLNKFRKMVW